MGLFVPVRVFQTLEREYEETRVPLNGDAAKADARETKIRVQYDAPSKGTVRATVAVEWTREITVRVVEVVFARTLALCVAGRKPTRRRRRFACNTMRRARTRCARPWRSSGRGRLP